MTTFDDTKFFQAMNHISALQAQIDKELEGLLNDIDPQWREHEAERQAERAALKTAKPRKHHQPLPTEIIEMPKSNRIDSDVMDVLKSALCEGNLLFLPPKQMERKLYERTNEVLTRLGGKWKGGKTRGHIFDDDPAPLLSEVLATGIMPLDNPLDFYETQPAVVETMLSKVTITPTVISEPSAGRGAIVRAAKAKYPHVPLHAIEVDPKRAEILRNIPDVNVHQGNFIEDIARWSKQAPDLILMNPPFTSPQDHKAYITHIYAAYEMLQAKGQLISIAPAGLKFNTDKRTSDFRAFIQQRGTIEDLPSGAFGDSGTLVATVIITMHKTKGDVSTSPAPARVQLSEPQLVLFA